MLYYSVLFLNFLISISGQATALDEKICEGDQEIFLKDDGPSIIIKSPNYPNLYPSHISCSFNFKTSNTNRIEVTCEPFDVTGLGWLCLFGKVEIDDEGGKRKTYCGSYSKISFSENKSMKFTFMSQFFRNYGFKCIARAKPVLFQCRCGRKNTINRIVGGKEVDKNEYPWQVGIVKPGQTKPFCGGSLVTNKHVVTASHCFSYIKKIEVILGEHDVRDEDETSIRVEVEKVEMHVKFNVLAMNDFDVAIVTFKSPIQFSKAIQPICLPNKDDTFLNQLCTITGWGRIGEYLNLSPVLQEAQVKVMSNEECSGYYDNITPRMICAGFREGGIDSCQGDSGGPLSCEKNERFVLTGAVSFGRGCAQPKSPGAYTRITELLDWINARISSGSTCN